MTAVPQAAVDAAMKVMGCEREAGYAPPSPAARCITHQRDWPCTYAAAVVDAVLDQGRSRWEYGIEMSLPQWNNGEPYMEWGASIGMSHRYDYTADNVHSLASGRPVYRRKRTTFPEVIGEREPFPRPDTTTNGKD